MRPETVRVPTSDSGGAPAVRTCATVNNRAKTASRRSAFVSGVREPARAAKKSTSEAPAGARSKGSFKVHTAGATVAAFKLPTSPMTTNASPTASRAIRIRASSVTAFANDPP